eukprot:4216159-Pleurochrysis_carterae.AAC.1
MHRLRHALPALPLAVGASSLGGFRHQEGTQPSQCHAAEGPHLPSHQLAESSVGGVGSRGAVVSPGGRGGTAAGAEAASVD